MGDARQVAAVDLIDKDRISLSLIGTRFLADLLEDSINAAKSNATLFVVSDGTDTLDEVFIPKRRMKGHKAIATDRFLGTFSASAP